MHAKRIASILAVASMLVGSLIGTATEAAAYPQVNVCGSSYGSLKQYPIVDPENGYRVGWIDTYYSSATGKNCAIARGDDSRASGFTHIDVMIGLTSQVGWAQEDGAFQNYTKYAGPVYVYAPGNTCIDVASNLLYDGYMEKQGLGTATQVRC
ncbi:MULTISPECIES: hypothetical protein [unclassified Streptomyces]|uniref:hypothetical protein n=1 Tax=unclassified Streptomyces TaxID=2593676 RepID=UPI002253F315|nr:MULTISPECIES: hypothetical protein [unclassified Streptomyces]MCX5078544.1 hypothetical protein [Streptomyces sp. NBC_00424]MCY0916571.1 hypothetical protein [Streptomyces sp. H27-G5]MCY0958374.1 hypothetical protein [Streptomyces sp. H27-H5]